MKYNNFIPLQIETFTLMQLEMRTDALHGQMEQLKNSIVMLIGKQESLIISEAYEIVQRIVKKNVQHFLGFPMTLDGMTYHVQLN